MSEELKPCPFCGSTDLCVVQARIEEYYSVEPEISCKKCHYTFKLKELAIAIDESPKTNADWWNRGIAKKWNTRPAEDEKDKEVDSLVMCLAKVKSFCKQHYDYYAEREKTDIPVLRSLDRYMIDWCECIIETINSTCSGKGTNDDTDR